MLCIFTGKVFSFDTHIFAHYQLLGCIFNCHFVGGQSLIPVEVFTDFFFTNGETAVWFVPAIISLYIVYPLLHRLYEKTNKLLYVVALLVFLASLLLTLFYDEEVAIRRINEVFIVRISTFLMGIALGRTIREKPSASCPAHVVLWTTLISIILYVITVCERWVERVLFLPFSFCIAYWVASILGCGKKENLIIGGFHFLGGITLEVYLLHERVLLVYDTYVTRYLMASLLSILTSLVIAVLIASIVSKGMLLGRPIKKSL